MRILVIDDTQAHISAALQTLSEGNELTTCSSYDEATELLEEKFDKTELDKKYKQYESEGIKNPYEKAMKETVLPYWDAVLCDLLMPASGEQCRNHELVGQEMPVGWSLALVAAEGGAKYVAVVTDKSHHDHPASALLDRFSKHVFVIDGAKVLMTNYVERVGIIGTEYGSCEMCGGSGKRLYWDKTEIDCHSCNGSGKKFKEYGKNWGKILKKLQGGDE